MGIIPQTYGSGSGNLVNYSYTDFDEGTGYVVYYASEGTSTNFLKKAVTYSTTIVQYAQCTTTNYQSATLDVDYDVLFNLPKTIRGTGIVNITMGVRNIAAESTNVYVICKVRKVSGGVETEIANKQSDTFTATPSAAIYSRTFQIEITIPQTRFRKNESLRLTIEMWGASPSANARIGWGNDPTDRNDSTAINPYQIINDVDTTKLEFHVPFVLAI